MYAAHQRGVYRRALGVGICLLAAALLFAPVAQTAGPGTLALVGGRVISQTDAGTFVGTVLVREGKIVAVGPSVQIPADAQRMDVKDCTITPGLIDARSTLWIGTASRESGSDGGLDVVDAVDPHDDDWKEVVRQGVTAVYVQPANTGIMGGRGAVLGVGPAHATEDLVIKADAAVQAALGISVPAPAAPVQTQLPRRFGPDPTPAEPSTPAPSTGNSLSRFNQYEQLKRALEAVKKYDDDWKKREETATKTKAADAKKSTASKDASPSGPKRDFTKEFLRKAFSGAIPVRIEAHREDDVRHALSLADEFRIRVVLDGVSNPGDAAAVVVARRLPMVLGPFIDLEDVPAQRKDRVANWPSVLMSPGVPWALGTFSNQSRGSRMLRVQAAAAVARGVDPDRVLQAMTRDAAEILGVGDRLGTIAPGKQADLAVFAGDPLDPSVPARLVLSRGIAVYEDKLALTFPSLDTKVRGDTLPAKLPKRFALRTQCLCLEDGKPQRGAVVVDNGKIVAVGSNPTISDRIPIYDLGSQVITPGLVAGHCSLGLAGAIDDASDPNASQVRAADVFDAKHRNVRQLVNAGFTSALYAPGSANVIAGTACGVRLGRTDPMAHDAGVKFVLAANARGDSRAATATSNDPVAAFLNRSRGPGRYPGSLAGQVELIELTLNGRAPRGDLYVPEAIRRQLDNERRRVINEVMDRRRVALFEAHSRAEVDAALRLIDRYQLRGVLIEPEEIIPFLSEIKRLGVGIVARPIHANDYDRPALELAAAGRAGVPVAFGGATAAEMRMTAALAVNAGFPRAAAWRGLTTAATMLGLPESAGKLVSGGPADLVVWNGSPLDLRCRPLCVIVDGSVVCAAP